MSTLVGKLSKASLTVVGRIGTDKRNEQQKYDYISADAVLSAAGKALAEEGVIVFPNITAESIDITSYTNNYGKEATRIDAVVEFVFIISDGESQFETRWLGRGTDYASPDKAMYKAITSGHKYFLMKLLNIGVGNEDGEHDDPQQRPAQPTQQRPQAAKSQPAPAQAAKSQPEKAGPDIGDGDNGLQHQGQVGPSSLDEVEAISQNGDDFESIPQHEKAESKNHGRLFAVLSDTFNGLDLAAARSWVIENWTTKYTPQDIRFSATKLTDEEKGQVADAIKVSATKTRKAFEAHQAKAAA